MIEKINIIQAAKLSEILKSPELSRFVLILYRDLFDKKNTRFCATAISEFAKVIKEKGILKLEEMATKQKYKMKEGIVIYDYESRKKYTSETITDKEASELLKKFPKLADKFELIPLKK